MRTAILSATILLVVSSNSHAADPPQLLVAEKDAGVKLRNGAGWLLLMDRSAVVGEKGILKDSPVWTTVHDEVKKMIAKNGERRSLHIRFYSNGKASDGAKFNNDLYAQAKRSLADLNIYVVCIDHHTSNDNTTWAKFLKDKR